MTDLAIFVGCVGALGIAWQWFMTTWVTVFLTPEGYDELMEAYLGAFNDDDEGDE